MPVTYDSSVKFDKTKQVPNSCIEAAEFLVQVMAGKGKSVTWHKSGAIRKPHVYAEFASCYVNITATDNFHNLVTQSVKDYPFNNALPTKGEGICLVNKLQDADPNAFNMHFGAVVKTGTGTVEVSDMNEPGNGVVGLAPLVTTTIRKVDDFRGGDYPKSRYALGKLTTTPDKGKQALEGVKQ